jgi:hypothetical protein
MRTYVLYCHNNMFKILIYFLFPIRSIYAPYLLLYCPTPCLFSFITHSKFLLNAFFLSLIWIIICYYSYQMCHDYVMFGVALGSFY